MTSLTRGPLPSGVYWRRRLALLVTVLVMGVALTSMLRGGGEEEADVTASPSAGEATPSTGPTPSDPSTPAETEPGEPSGTTETPETPETPEPTEPVAPTPEPLATPVGRCDNTDVLVTPEVVDAVAGRTVTLALGVRTAETEACTWRMSARHLAVTLTRSSSQGGTSEVWSTRQCPGMVPDQDVVVRRDVDSTVTLDWSGRFSERGCPAQTGWVEPGELQVAAAAYGGQPATLDLDLRAPGSAAPDVTSSATPDASPSTATAD